MQAQTVANFFLAFDQNLAIVPVLNKIDMSSADPDKVAEEMQQVPLATFVVTSHCYLYNFSLLAMSTQQLSLQGVCIALPGMLQIICM